MTEKINKNYNFLIMNGIICNFLALTGMPDLKVNSMDMQINDLRCSEIVRTPVSAYPYT